MLFVTLRTIGDGIHFDLGADDGASLDGGAGEARRVLEVITENLVLAPEIARVLEIGAHAHDVVEAGTIGLEDALDGKDGGAGLFLDRPMDHIALGILGDLAGYEDEVADPNTRMEGQVGILGSDRIALGLAHRLSIT